MQERRKDVRIPLDDLCYAFVSQESGPTLECILLDVSPCGARVGLPAGEVHPQVGSGIILHVEDPCLSMFFNQRKGRVVWNSGVQVGVFFDERINTSPQELADALGLDLIIGDKIRNFTSPLKGGDVHNL